MKEKIKQFNKKLQEKGRHGDMVYPFCDLNLMLKGKTAVELLNIGALGEYDPNHNYFLFDKLGELVSLSDNEVLSYIRRYEYIFANPEKN